MDKEELQTIAQRVFDDFDELTFISEIGCDRAKMVLETDGCFAEVYVDFVQGKPELDVIVIDGTPYYPSEHECKLPQSVAEYLVEEYDNHAEAAYRNRTY